MVILTAINPPTEGIRHKQSDTAAFFGESDLGVGTLYISESFLIWISNEGRGFSLSYPTISMHAISRDSRTSPRPCIYMILDSIEEKPSGRETNVDERRFAEKMAACALKTDSTASKTENVASGAGEEGEHNGSSKAESEGEGDDDEEHSRSTEIRFVPADVDSLETMYQALSECQALHPDENESFSEDEDEDFSEPQMGGASDEFRFDDSGQLVLSRMRGVRTGDDAMPMEDEFHPAHEDDDEEMETGQFEDAPE